MGSISRGSIGRIRRRFKIGELRTLCARVPPTL
jgi:hypothetical protein